MTEILLIGSPFFGYRDRVAMELRRQGYCVDTIDDRPSEGVVFKSLAKVAPRALAKEVAKHADAIVSMIARGGYKHVVYMGGMTFLFTRGQVERMRSAARGADCAAYLWDSIENSPALAASLDLFDRALSFEPADCERYGMELRPLFYSGAYAGLPAEPEGGFLYDACFVGSVHQPGKFEAVKRICDGLEREGLRVFRHFFMPSKSVTAFRRATNPAYMGVDFAYEPLPAERVAEVYSLSRAVVDSPQARQAGLTMRTIETVGSRRKLITANPDVRNYDFYRYGDVAVVEEGSLPSKSFFDRSYHELPPEIYESYSIASFAGALLGGESGYRGYERGGR